MFFALGIAVAAADQVAKWLVVHRLHDGPIAGDLLRLTLTHNTGAAFGLFPGARLSFIVVSVVAALGLVYAHRVLAPGDARRPLLALILGGNLGNLVDRIRLGHVVDFIDMGIGTARWPVYNLADVAVVLGAAGLAVWMLAGSGSARRRAGLSPEIDAAATEENPADTR
jgi:signal peptidase II